MLGSVELNNTLHTQFSRAQAFLPQQILGFLMVLKFLLEEFLIWFTRPVEVFLRRKFGVRGHGLFQTIQICIVGTVVGGIFASRDIALALFWFASAILAVIHYCEAVRWENRGSPPRYSWSNGEPGPFWAWIARGVQALRINPDRFVTVPLICRFYESLLVLVIGLAVWPVSLVLSCYLIGCSVALFIKGLIIHNRFLNLRRDQIDARIMSSYLANIHKTAGGQGEEQYFVVRLAEPAVHKRDDDNGGEEPTSPEHQSCSAVADTADKLVSFSCRKCKAQFQVHQKHRGRKGTCKKCGSVIVVGAGQN